MNAFFFISIYSLDSLFTIGRSRLNSMSRKEMPVKSRHCVIFRYLQLKGWEPLMKPITNYRCILISAFNWKFNFRYYILLHILKYILTWYIMKCRHILRMKTFFSPHTSDRTTLLTDEITILKHKNIADEWHIQQLWQRHIERLSRERETVLMRNLHTFEYPVCKKQPFPQNS